MSDWPIHGPKAAREFLDGVVEAGSDFQVYLSNIIAKSGLSTQSAVYHELKNLLEVLRLAVSYDQLDVGNLARVRTQLGGVAWSGLGLGLGLGLGCGFRVQG